MTSQIDRVFANKAAETASREELEALQWHKTKRHLEYLYERSPFYRRRLDAAGAVPDKIRSLTDFQAAVPLMRKTDVLEDLEEHPPYGSRLCVSTDQLVQVTMTGGTSGVGQEVYAQTAADVARATTIYAQGCAYAGIRPGDVVASTWPVGVTAGSQWIAASYQRQHVLLLALGIYDSVTKLNIMRRFGARVLTATPSYLMQLEATARSELGWDVAKDLPVDRILISTEGFSAARAETLERTWGAKLFEWYGATQGVLTANCERGAVHEGKLGMLHLYPHMALMETLDPETHEPVSYGEEGEVVVTLLGVEASPLLRFATGDKARLLPAEECGCGRPYDGFQSGSIARYDDMLKVRGVSFWPSMTDRVIFGDPTIENYQGAVTTAEDGGEELVVEVEFAPDTPPDARPGRLETLAAALRSAIGLRMGVVEATRKLPEFTDVQSKAKRWLDQRSK